MIQLALFDATGAACQYHGGKLCGRDICKRNGGRVCVICSVGLFGDAPRCAWVEPDNSKEACARRVAWAKEHEGKA